MLREVFSVFPESFARRHCGVVYVPWRAKTLGYPAGHHGTVPFFSWPAGISGILELGGGLLVLLGLFTRPVAFILSGEMAVAYFMVHASDAWWPIHNKGELAVIYCFVFLYLSVAGPGRLSLDHCRKCSATPPVEKQSE